MVITLQSAQTLLFEYITNKKRMIFNNKDHPFHYINRYEFYFFIPVTSATISYERKRAF